MVARTEDATRLAVIDSPGLSHLQAFALRQFRKADTAHLMSSWMQSLKKACKVKRDAVPRFMDALRLEIEAIREHDSTRTIVLSAASDPDYIAGWLCFSRIGLWPVVHYTYIKPSFRLVKPHSCLFWRLMEGAAITPSSKLLYTCKSKRAHRVAKRFDEAEYWPVKEFLK